MPSKNNLPEEDLLPFGALTGSPVDSSVREQLGQATNGKQKVQRSPRALRPLWYSIPILVIALAIAGYLIGLTLWSQSSLKHWKAQDYEAAQAGYEGQRTWTGIGIEAWVAHYNLGTTLVRQDRVDEGVAELRTAFDLVPKATEVQPGRLEPFSYECRVRVNQLRSSGSTADAVSVYQEAEDTIAPCQTASGGGGQSGDQNQSGGQSDQQSGGESNNPADENKERVGDKKQQTEEESQGQSGSQDQQQQQGQQGQQENPTPSPSPSENPYEGETQDQKERREQLENQNKDRQQNQRDTQDGKRDGNPNGAW